MPDLRDAYAALWPLGVSLAAIVLGWAWAAPGVNRLDLQVAGRIHRVPLPGWLDGVVRLLRPLGGTRIQWGLVLLALAVRWRAGLALTTAMAVCLLLERGVKILARRPRPFTSCPEIRPPPRLTPADPSYPSGDAARAWMLACFLAGQPGCPGWLAALALAAACGVSFGRVRLGVHAPLDVLAGAGLGAGLGLASARILTLFG